ncbi:NlpC/P60 family protein [Aliarcobacter cibarius]|jgi:murein DD-endopeptidase / murein LD-carboxypeptidase|uniref:Peptidase P60 n=1 Tax=Aliarcobacter cibarius TaxID=255507 RepID=A0ABY2VD15_9BACT|nr:NlpC/P60 family protein [Aliarcobacter cibarius]QEZ88405.1 outer membrane lipoprotein, NlpC/P60 family [Aliarcobacter cibarius]TLT01903.1 peptidase P60 [Aliarcobacter cibarius]TLT02238.1 peptidase P60 [Aliarcobacter cibarius]
MKAGKIFVITLLSTLFFTGCSYKTTEEKVDVSKYQNTEKQVSIHQKATFPNNKLNVNKAKNIDVFNTKSDYTSKQVKINNNLFDFYNNWEGVRYKMGGTSKNGIDCSGFVQKALKEKFNLTLPRSTGEQARIGKPIKKSELQMGDLVFFKTGRTNHVGIYIEDGKFMHASTKIGVTISELESDYFAKNYWKAQRVFK